MTEAIILDSKLDLVAASALKSTLLENTDKEVVLDMSDVKHFGALCMQVLLAAAKSANSENRKISMTNVSDRVIDQMRVMGMTPEAICRGHQ